MARLDRYRIGIPRELSEIRTQPWLSEGSLTCDPGDPSFNCAPTQFHQQCIITQVKINIKIKNIYLMHSKIFVYLPNWLTY